MDNNEHINTVQPAPPPTGALPSETAARKSFKGKVEYMGAGLLIYTCIFYGMFFADMFAHFIYYAIKTMGDQAEYTRLIKEYSENLLESAGGLIAGVLVGVLFLSLFFIKALPLKKIFASHRKMTFGKLVMLVCVLMCCQLPFLFFDEGVEWLLNQIGYSLQQAIESSQSGSTTISMFIYASFLGPIAEEIVYRGFVMHTFERAGCGKFCAILSSAILFGIMHANPTQSIFAIYVGVIFGYAAMEYGLIWSIALHIINNFLFGDVMSFIENKLPEPAGDILGYSVLGVMFAAGVAVFIVKRKHASSYVRENNPPAKHYGWIFSCISILAFVVMNIGFALLAFQDYKG